MKKRKDWLAQKPAQLACLPSPPRAAIKTQMADQIVPKLPSLKKGVLDSFSQARSSSLTFKVSPLLFKA
jgi:hypothetical protein